MNFRRLVIWSIIGTGISSVTTQLITIREFLTQFHGNEITISLCLSSWLLLSGLGSLLAKAFSRGRATAYALLLLLIAAVPLAQLMVIRGFREFVFIHGASPGFYAVLGYIVSSTAPYCLLIGFILPYSLRVMHQAGQSFTSGQLYLTDNAGDILGGALFSFVLVYRLKPFGILAVTSSLLFLVALAMLLSLRRYVLLGAGCALAVLFYLYAADSRFETRTLAGQYGEITRYVESPFGRIVITREGSQNTVWETGVPLYSNENVVNSEEKVHYPLAQIRAPRSVLLVSGGIGETVEEVFKHGVRRVDYVELDPHVTREARKLGFLKPRPGLEVMNTDGRYYIKTTKRRYDAIIMDLPEPDTFQVNRFFTAQFFGVCKKILNPGGVLSFGVSYSQNYISEVRRKKLSSLYHTARAHFGNVRVIPGQEAYFICRDGLIDLDIPALLERKGIRTAYIAGFYRGNVTSERVEQLAAALRGAEDLNTDFEPRLMHVSLREWFARHGSSPAYFIGALGLFTLVYLAFMKREEYVLFSTGFAAMGVEMLIVFAFQVLYGYIYLKIGAVVTVFLLGLLPGAYLGNRFRGGERGKLLASETGLLFLLGLFGTWALWSRAALPDTLFLGYAFVFSTLCGFQFPVAARLVGEKQSPAAGCLAADLTGAAVGTLATGTLIIPLMGIHWAVIFLGGVKISSAVLMLTIKRQRG